jgi:membrane protease YdiL (CAAX protease family)
VETAPEPSPEVEAAPAAPGPVERSLPAAFFLAVSASFAVVLLSVPLTLLGLGVVGPPKGVDGTLDARTFAVVAAATDLSLLAMGGLLIARAGKRPRATPRHAIRSTAVACVAVAIVNGAGSWAISWTGESYTGFPDLTPGGWSALVFVVAGLLAPFAEELFFREALLARVFPRSRRAVSVLATSALFGLLHVGSGGAVLVVTLFLMGVILAELRLRTGALGPSILVHGLNNVAALLLAILAGT